MIKLLLAVENGYNDIAQNMIFVIFRKRTQVQPAPNSMVFNEANGLINAIQKKIISNR